MLIEFKVANFRSIREKQTLSLVANNADKDLPACVIERNMPGLKDVKFLKGAAIYGANASGKSNIVAAIYFLVNFVNKSATELKPDDLTGTESFKLDRESASNPSEFEITFVVDGIRYLFGLQVTPQRVTEEYLVAYSKGVPQGWYHRKFDKIKKDYEWAKSSTSFKHDKSLQEKTRPNALFLSVASQFNHPQLTQVYNWFKNNLRFILLGANSMLYPVFTANLYMRQVQKNRILSLLNSADIGVTNAKISMREIIFDEPKKLLPQSKPTEIEAKGRLKSGMLLNINLSHKAEGIEPVELNFEHEESAGTRRFFAIVGPWLDILDNGYTAFVDEIETSLHPILVKELLKILFSKENNPKGAQIIFTTHNPILLDTTFIRRDQIWLTEKTPAGATDLYPLTDYQPRKDEALAKGYLAGRYGAIPYIPEGLKL